MLALWSYNWNWGAAASASATSTATVALTPSTYTSGKGKRNNDYQLLDDDYWDVREMNLVRATPPKAAADEELSPVNIATTRPDPKRAETLAAFKNASSLDEMRSLSQKLREMS